MDERAISINKPNRYVLTIRDLACIMIAITVFMSISPFFAWSSFAGGVGVIIFKVIQLFSMALMITQIPWSKLRLNKFLCASAIMAIYFFYCFFTGVVGGTTHPFLIGNILVYAFYALVTLSGNDILLKSFGILEKIFAVILFYTLIVYILILLGVPIPSVKLISGEEGRAAAGMQYYQNYLGCLIINQSGELLYRFTSVFTEPGVVGTFCAFFLAADGMKFKKSKKDIIFLIAGILSLSVAFYVMAIVALAFKFLRKGGVKAFSGFILIVVLYFVFINVNFNNFALQVVQQRLTITESGLAGDNRMHEEARVVFENFLNSDLKTILMGYGNTDATTSAGISVWQMSASYKEAIFQLGFIGYGLLILWFAVTPLVCYRSKNKYITRFMYSYVIIFILSQYQRPYMKSLFLVYILLAGCLSAEHAAIKENESIPVEKDTLKI